MTKTLAPYPALLTDVSWKKVEKLAEVSDTGVGGTLREAQKAWQKLAKAVVDFESHKIDAGPATVAQNAAVVAFKKTNVALGKALAKAPDPKKKAVIKDYQNIVEWVVRDLDPKGGKAELKFVGGGVQGQIFIDSFNGRVRDHYSKFPHKI
jgi:hypothetical protein